jgi:hypothetical protein
MARSQLTQNGHVASLIASVLRRLAELAIFDRHASWLALRIGFVEQPDRRKAIALQSGKPSAQCRPRPRGASLVTWSSTRGASSNRF